MMPTNYRSNDLFDTMLGTLMAPRMGMNRLDNMLRIPEADVVETETEIRVVAELPGLRPEDVDLSLENNVLTISGEKREERTEGQDGRTWHLSERRYGKFSRSFLLPRDVDAERIEAQFQDGLLTITIPKSEKARRRRISINGNGSEPRRVEAGSTEESR